MAILEHESLEHGQVGQERGRLGSVIMHSSLLLTATDPHDPPNRTVVLICVSGCCVLSEQCLQNI